MGDVFLGGGLLAGALSSDMDSARFVMAFLASELPPSERDGVLRP